MKQWTTRGAVAWGLNVSALLFFLVAGYFFYAPEQQNPSISYFGTGNDPLTFIWFLNWWHFALLRHLALFHSNFADAPVGTDLAWKTWVIGLGLLAFPFTAKYGALIVYNSLMLIAPGLASWGIYLAAFALTDDFMASIAAGLIFGCSSYMLGQMREHLNLGFVFAIPFCLWACIAAAKHGWRKWQLAVLLGIALAFEFGVSQELFATQVMFGAITLMIIFILHPAGRPSVLSLLPAMGIGLGISLIIIAPLIWEMLKQYADAGPAVSSPADFSTDLMGLVIPTPVDWLGGEWFEPLTKTFKGNFSEESAYIGLPLLCLLGFIWRRHRNLPAFQILGWVILLAGLFSFGPYLHIFGVEVSTAPWIIAGDLPFLKAMLPGRFMLYAWVAIALFLALWLAMPGRKWRRYAALALCLICLAPARAFDRHWTPLAVPSMLTNGAIPAGSEILILPEAGAEMGMQYELGMKFSLAGQGYLGCGSPLPFAAWPLYRSLFVAKYARYLPLIDPRMLSAFLAAYDVQYVVVLNDFDAGYAPKQIMLLFNAAGWKLVRADADANLLAPQSPAMPPDAMQIAAFMRMPPPEQRPMQIKSEMEWVHAIRAVSRFTGLNPGPFLDAYASLAHPPLPVEAIGEPGV